MTDNYHRQVSADNFEITRAMIEAGIFVLADQYGIVSEYGAEEIAEAVFRKMIAAAGGLDLFCNNAQKRSE